MKRALAILLLAGCAHATKPPSSNVMVAKVKPPPATVVAPKCGDDSESGLLDVGEAMNERVRAVCIRGTDDPMPELPVRVGTVLDAESVSTSVEKLFATEQFRSIDVIARRVDGGVEVTFEVGLRPMVMSFEIVGGEHLGPNDTIRSVTKVGARFDPAPIQRQMADLKERYGERGYPNAKITLEQSNGRVTIRIVEGAKTR